MDSNSKTGVRGLVATILVAGALVPLQALSQVPPRFYWKSLAGANAVPLIYNSLSGNSNPFDQGHTVTPGSYFEGSLALGGYAHMFALKDRSAMVAVLVPTGRVTADVIVAGQTVKQAASGFGDPMLEFDVNLIGPKAQKTIPDALRYEPGFSLDLLADLVVPIGEYYSDQALNIGQNRWYGRVGLPMIWQLGSWAPGRRTTLEFLPSAWIFGDNTDFVGQTLETDTKYQVDAHLTRDFTEHLWGSFDAVWYKGGKATLAGIEGEEFDTTGIGFTFGYQINDNVGVTFGYKSTVSDNAPGDLKMDQFMISLVSGWHPIIEGEKRLNSE
jgi:hypothetical protein